MNYCVPDFEREDEDPLRFFDSSRPTNTTTKPLRDDELVELLWQNGQVVMQTQNQNQNHQRSLPKKPLLPKNPITTKDEDLFIQEDEMASWLHYPLDYDASFDSDLLHSSSAADDKVAPSISPAKVQESMLQKDGDGDEARPSTATDTVVDSSETPRPIAAAAECCGGSGGAAVAEAEGEELGACEVTVTSSSGGSEEPSGVRMPAGDRKRKGREGDDDDCHSEDAGLDSAETKKNASVSTTARRSRAAEVHNLSERRRRDRINEKMKALQELIPRCNKSDKASMLDEAIEYLKSLQLQVQMMSMGSCMMPMGFPGVQQYMSPMLMGMGMGMGIDAGLSHQMMPFPSVLAGSSMPAPAAVNHLSPRLPMPAFHIPPVPTTQATSQPDNTLNSIRAQNPNLLQVPNFTDCYQHYLGLHHMPVPPWPPRVGVPYQGPFTAENPSMPPPNTSKGVDGLESDKSR